MHLKDKDYLLLENLMDSLVDLVYFKDLDSKFIMINKAAARWQGFDHPDDAVGTSDFDSYEEEDARRMRSDEQHIMETGEPLIGVEEHETRKDGQQQWVFTTKMPLRDDNGKIIGTFGISRDITEHKEAELRAERYAEEARCIKEDMEEEVHMAAELQKNFLPSSFPAFPEGASAEKSCLKFSRRVKLVRPVSGDYCTVVRLSPTELGVFLCDVSGVGVRAALGTALVRGVMQEVEESYRHDPGTYLGRVSQLLRPLLIREEEMLFNVTACGIILDVSSGILRIASADHPVPICIHADRTAQWLYEDISLRGPALASRENASYTTIECRLEPGDSIALFSDGLFSACNNTGEAYGETRVLDSARGIAANSLDEILQGLEADALAFARSGSFTDDVCMIGFQLRRLLQ